MIAEEIVIPEMQRDSVSLGLDLLRKRAPRKNLSALLLALQLPELIARAGDRLFDHVAAEIVRWLRLRLDHADRVPGAELRR